MKLEPVVIETEPSQPAKKQVVSYVANGVVPTGVVPTTVTMPAPVSPSTS